MPQAAAPSDIHPSNDDNSKGYTLGFSIEVVVREAMGVLFPAVVVCFYNHGDGLLNLVSFIAFQVFRSFLQVGHLSQEKIAKQCG